MWAVRGIPRNRFGAEQPDRARHVDEEWRRTVEHFVRRAGLGRRPGLDRASGSPGAPLGAGVVLRSSPTLWLGVPLASIRNSRSRGHIHIAHGRIREPLPEGALDVPAGSWRARSPSPSARRLWEGLTKFEPTDMERLLVPDVPALNERESPTER